MYGGRWNLDGFAELQTHAKRLYGLNIAVNKCG